VASPNARGRYETWGDLRDVFAEIHGPVEDSYWDSFVSHAEDLIHHPPFSEAYIDELSEVFLDWHSVNTPECLEIGESETTSLSIGCLRVRLLMREFVHLRKMIEDWRAETFGETDVPFQSQEDASAWIEADLSASRSQRMTSHWLDWWGDDACEDRSISSATYVGSATASLAALSLWLANSLGCTARDAVSRVLTGRVPCSRVLEFDEVITPGPMSLVSIVITVRSPLSIDKDTLWDLFASYRREVWRVAREPGWTEEDAALVDLYLSTPELSHLERCQLWNTTCRKLLLYPAFVRRLGRAKRKLLSRFGGGRLRIKSERFEGGQSDGCE